MISAVCGYFATNSERFRLPPSLRSAQTTWSGHKTNCGMSSRSAWYLKPFKFSRGTTKTITCLVLSRSDNFPLKKGSWSTAPLCLSSQNVIWRRMFGWTIASTSGKLLVTESLMRMSLLGDISYTNYSVFDSSTTHQDQACALAQSSIFFVFHGNAVGLAAFLPPGSVVIEYCIEFFLGSPDIGQRLYRTVGLQYLNMPCAEDWNNPNVEVFSEYIQTAIHLWHNNRQYYTWYF